MTGGIAVLIACICAAAPLPAWLVLRARAAAEDAQQAGRPEHEPREDSIAIPASDIAKGEREAPTAALGDGGDATLRDTRAEEAAGAATASDRDADYEGTPTTTADEPGIAREDPAQAGADPAPSEPDIVAERSSPPHIPASGAHDDTETTAPIRSGADVPLIDAGLLEPPRRLPDQTSRREEEEPAASAAMVHEDDPEDPARLHEDVSDDDLANEARAPYVRAPFGGVSRSGPSLEAADTGEAVEENPIQTEEPAAAGPDKPPTSWPKPPRNR